jgi:drug/metabolite transporter (DMT)-like permease
VWHGRAPIGTPETSRSDGKLFSTRMRPLAVAPGTHTQTVVALVLALASTTLISLAYLREHDAVGDLPPLSLQHPLSSVRLLLGSRAWLAAFAMESGGFVLYVAALALAPLALVQSVAAGGIGILAVASARLGHRRLTKRETLGAGVSVAGLLFLALSLLDGGDQGAQGSLIEIGLWLGGTCAAAVLVLMVGRAFVGTAAADGIAGGLLFSCGDISTKLATQGGARAAFALVAIFGYLLGTSLLQIGYQRGAALTIAGIATLLTNALPIAAGTVLLHETLSEGGPRVLRILAFATVVAGAVLLARPHRGDAGGRLDSTDQMPTTPAQRRPASPPTV